MFGSKAKKKDLELTFKFVENFLKDKKGLKRLSVSPCSVVIEFQNGYESSFKPFEPGTKYYPYG